MNSISVLRAAIFGTADSPYTSIVRDKKLHITIPVSQKGLVPEKLPKTPFYQVGLCAEVLNTRELLAPNNLRPLDVISVIKKGMPLDTDDGIDELPDIFFDSLGEINEEICIATGFDPDKALELPELLAFRKPTNESKPKETNVTNTTQITETQLRDLGIDIESLAEKGLTVEKINTLGITLEKLQELAFQ